MKRKKRISERLSLDDNVTLGEFQASLSQYAFAAGFVKGKVTLDIACGSGFGSDYLKREGAKLVVGGDRSVEAIKSAKQLCRSTEGIDFVLLEAIRLPFPDDYFEAVVSVETLEHLPEHDRFLQECKRVLKDGGILVCSTPNRNVSAYVGGKQVNPYHINELSARRLESLLGKYFAEVQLWGHDYWLRGNIVERKLVALLRSTIFRVWRVRQLAYFIIGLVSRWFQPIDEKTASPSQHINERYKPFPLSDSVEPAGLIAVARCIKHRRNTLAFSVVIPTKDRLDDLSQCVQSVLGQTRKPKEIIVVDGSVHQQIEGKIAEMCGKQGIPFKYIKQTEGKFGRAKNLGVIQAEGDIVLFVDDDVILEKSYIEQLEKVYQDDVDGLVGGIQGICTNIARYNPIKEVYCRLFMLGGHSKDKTELLSSGACFVPITLSRSKRADGFVGSAHSYRKTVFRGFQFDEEFEYGDENNFSIRVSRKYQLYITPHAKFVHNLSPVGRNFEQYQTMNTYARYHIFRKVMPQTLKNKLCFVWSQIGWLIGYLDVCLVKPTKQNRDYATGSIKGTLMIVRSVIHRKDVP